MACEICGYSYCYSSHSCPQCTRRRTPVNPMTKEHVEAGHNFVEGIFKFLAAFFLNPYLCLIAFAGLCYSGLVMLAPILGIIPSRDYLAGSLPPWEVLPVWYTVISVVIPVSVAVFLRTYIRLLMRWVFIIGVTALVIWGVVAMVIHLNNR